MTPELIELSKQAAEVLGVRPLRCITEGKTTETKSPEWIWLAEDSGRCADIAADRGMDIDALSLPDRATVEYLNKNRVNEYFVAYYADHNGDRNQAWRVAVLKAVIEQGKL